MTDTICAIATAPGGALGIVRVSGPRAVEFTNSIFSGSLLAAPTHTLRHGTISDPSTGEMLDEVVVSVYREPHSYTGEESTEISCHGSPYVLRRLVELLIAAGARHAAPGEFTQRAFLNGRMDLSQAEAVADLIAAETRAAHRMAVSQLRGAFSQRLASLRGELLRLTSLLELELDFSDQDVEFASRSELVRLCTEIETDVSALASSFHNGNALKSGVPVAIVGAPNVGKSTLLNQLVGDERAIVSRESGTTRDTIEDTTVIGGILFRFIDTAGIRHTVDNIEQMGIQRAKRAASQARIILLMSEPGVAEPEIDTREDQHIIHIVNKTPDFQAINGTGLDSLRQRLVSCIPMPAEGDTVVTNLRHYHALSLALDDLHRVRQALDSRVSADLVAEDLRLCLHHIAEITGSEITNDEVLGSIFRNFCIGK